MQMKILKTIITYLIVNISCLGLVHAIEIDNLGPVQKSKTAALRVTGNRLTPRNDSLRAGAKQSVDTVLSNKTDEKDPEIVIVAGNSNGAGGGLAVAGFPVSHYAVKQIEDLDGWNSFVVPLLEKIKMRQPLLAELLFSEAKKNYWYVLPVKLVKLPAVYQAVPFTDYEQDIINNRGEIFIAGRAKRTFIQRGENLFHEMIMSVLMKHPSFKLAKSGYSQDQVLTTMMDLHEITRKLEVILKIQLDQVSDNELENRLREESKRGESSIFENAFELVLTREAHFSGYEKRSSVFAVIASPKEISEKSEAIRRRLEEKSLAEKQAAEVSGRQERDLEIAKTEARSTAKAWLAQIISQNGVQTLCEANRRLFDNFQSGSALVSVATGTKNVETIWQTRDKLAELRASFGLLNGNEDDAIQNCQRNKGKCNVDQLLKDRELDSVQKTAAYMIDKKLGQIGQTMFILYFGGSFAQKDDYYAGLDLNERKKIADVARRLTDRYRHTRESIYIGNLYDLDSNITKYKSLKETDFDGFAKLTYLIMSFNLIVCDINTGF